MTITITRRILSIALVVATSVATAQSRKPLTATAAFVSPGASPSVVRSTNAVAECYGVCKTLTSTTSTTTTTTITSTTTTTTVPRRRGTALEARKKNKGSGKSKSGKLQVLMLEHVEGTGKIGDVVMVAPAFFENSLRRTKSARPVTDEEVAEMRETSAAERKEKTDSARTVADEIASLEAVSFRRKAGPDGHLFGGIKTKDILGEIKTLLGKGTTTKTLEGKQVKVVKIEDSEGNSLKQGPIKRTGDFQATISILDDINADVTITVASE